MSQPGDDDIFGDEEDDDLGFVVTPPIEAVEYWLEDRGIQSTCNEAVDHVRFVLAQQGTYGADVIYMPDDESLFLLITFELEEDTVKERSMNDVVATLNASRGSYGFFSYIEDLGCMTWRLCLILKGCGGASDSQISFIFEKAAVAIHTFQVEVLNQDNRVDETAESNRRLLNMPAAGWS